VAHPAQIPFPSVPPTSGLSSSRSSVSSSNPSGYCCVYLGSSLTCLQGSCSDSLPVCSNKCVLGSSSSKSGQSSSSSGYCCVTVGTTKSCLSGPSCTDSLPVCSTKCLGSSASSSSNSNRSGSSSSSTSLRFSSSRSSSLSFSYSSSRYSSNGSTSSLYSSGYYSSGYYSSTIVVFNSSSGFQSSYPYEFCGDNIRQVREQCDDGSRNGQVNDPCSVTCQLVYLPNCGNQTIDPGEECDHGTGNNGRLSDSCTLLCKNKVGSCGNGSVESALGEQCDDGNQIENDDCSNACTWSKLSDCGDGVVQSDFEQCDAGVRSGDYVGSPCHSNCVLPYCGDGIKDINEECDDRNNIDGDGCTAVCTNENPAAPLLVGNLVNPYNSGNGSNVSYNQLPNGQGNNPNTIPQYYGNIPTPARTPTGPGLVIFLASGAAAGVGVVRRRFVRKD
jgi:cysteine-rich repeat protein